MIVIYTVSIDLASNVNVAEGDPPLEVCIMLDPAQDGVATIRTAIQTADSTGSYIIYYTQLILNQISSGTYSS